MLLLKFNLEDIDKCTNVTDVFRAMGIGIYEDDPQDLKFTNKEVFGDKANYQNIFINDKTSNYIYDLMNKYGDRISNRFGSKLPSSQAIAWSSFAPTSSGPRYDKIAEAAGEINESVLYIVTPDDPLYIKDAPAEEGEDESTSNS